MELSSNIAHRSGLQGSVELRVHHVQLLRPVEDGVEVLLREQVVVTVTGLQLGPPAGDGAEELQILLLLSQHVQQGRLVALVLYPRNSLS